MRFGIATFATDEGIRPAALGRAVEERGFDSLFVAEHSHIPTSRETPYPGGEPLERVYYRTLDPFVTLSAVAEVTTDLIVGTGIAILPQRDVIHAAKQVASLDLISGGRFVFGVGVGWNREEMLNHGVDPSRRGARMTEQLGALKALWTEDEAEYHGEHISFDPVFCWPKPVRKPHPPIYLGGQSEAALTRLAEHGDGWLPTGHTPPEEIRRVRAWLDDRGRADVGITLFEAPTDRRALEQYIEAGVERIAFRMDTLPEAETLNALDELARIADPLRAGVA